MLRVSAPLVYIRGRTAPRRQWVIATLVARGDAVVRLREYYQDPNAPRADDVLPAAFAAVRNVAGEVLLVRRIDDGYWELPGGRLEVGESAAQAVIREVAEESGVVIALVGALRCLQRPHSCPSGPRRHRSPTAGAVLPRGPVHIEGPTAAASGRD